MSARRPATPMTRFSLGCEKLEARRLFAADVEICQPTMASFLARQDETAQVATDATAKAETTPVARSTGVVITTPALETLAQDDADYSIKTYLANQQDTDVSSSGKWGAARYRGETNTVGASGKVTLEDDASKGKLSAKAEGDASLFKTEHKAEYQMPKIEIDGKEMASGKATAEANVLVGVSGKAEAEAVWTGSKAGVTANAEVFAGVEANGKAGVETRSLGLKSDANAEGYARAGAEAKGEAKATREGVELSGNAFAGAKAGGEVKTSFGGIGVSAEGEAWAGAGAEGGLGVKMGEDGKYGFQVSLGASPIVGGKAGFGLEVDPSEVVKFADLPDNAKTFAAEADKVMSEVSNFFGF